MARITADGGGGERDAARGGAVQLSSIRRSRKRRVIDLGAGARGGGRRPFEVTGQESAPSRFSLPVLRDAPARFNARHYAIRTSAA